MLLVDFDGVLNPFAASLVRECSPSCRNGAVFIIDVVGRDYRAN